MDTFKEMVFTNMGPDRVVEIRKISNDYTVTEIYSGLLGDIDSSIVFEYADHPSCCIGREVNRDLDMVIFKILIISYEEE